MKKRLLPLLLAGAMTCSILSGCADSGKEDKKEEQNSQEDSSKEDDQEDDSKDETAEKELTTVKILCKNDFSADIKTENWETANASCEVLIADLEEIGIRLELECIDNESFENVVNTRMASGQDLPDLIAYTWMSDAETKIVEWGESGLVYSINDLLDQYDEDGSIKTFYDEKTPGVWEQNMTEDGTVYWFSYLWNEGTVVDQETGEEYTYASPRVLSIREDWVEAVGEEMKDVYTPDELLALLKKMRENDANGNGVEDEVLSINIESFDNGIATAFGLSSNLLGGYFENENKVFSNFYHENFPAYIEYMSTLYESGLYDTARLTGTDTQLISEDRAAGAFDYLSWDYEAALPGIEEGKTYYSPIIIDQDGDYENGFPVYMDTVDALGYCNYFVPTGCENPEALIRLMDYVYTDRYAVLCRLGLEGEGYEIDENGNYVTKDETKSLFQASVGLYALPAVRITPLVVSRDNDQLAPYMQEKEKKRIEFGMERYPLADQVEITPQALAMATEEENTFLSEKVEMLETYANELLVDLILGNKSIDNLPEYQAELEKLGLNEYLDIMQARRDRVLNAQ